MNFFKIITTPLVIFIAALSFAHGDLDTQIQELTESIKKNKNKASLYLERGRLYRQHSQYDKAIEDFNTVKTLAPNDSIVALELAHTYFDKTSFDTALVYTDHFLEKNPRHASALFLRGKIYAAINCFENAIADYRNALDIVTDPSPEDYMNFAKFYLQLTSGDYEKAIDALRLSRSKIGFTVSLEEQIVNWEIERKNYNAALEALDAIMKEFSRKEKWLVRKAEVYELKGNKQQAKVFYQKAQDEIERLPEHIKKTPLVVDLKNRVQTALAKLDDE